ncbi:hypothetical protein QL285_007282 [Trifolium repens]|nr:hypothetical protein QL285_007282 [Trifolium repens]
MLCFVVYYVVYGNNLWEQVLDSSITLQNFVHQLLECWNLTQRLCFISGSDVGRTCNCFGSDTGWCLQNATAAELGAAQTYSVAVKWKSLTPGRFKCNIDTSFVSHLNRVGIA